MMQNRGMPTSDIFFYKELSIITQNIFGNGIKVALIVHNSGSFKKKSLSFLFEWWDQWSQKKFWILIKKLSEW